jgi:predicted kinase
MQKALASTKNGQLTTKNKPSITVVIGESGSGKSFWTREAIDSDSKHKSVRVNRDSIRAMLHQNSGSMEKHVISMEKDSIEYFISKGYSVFVDDTNLREATVTRWRELADSLQVEFKTHRMETPLDECISNDCKRIGDQHVGRAVIERQFLDSGRLKLPENQKIVIVDVDGTVANHEGHRGPFDEHMVIFDRPYKVVVDWVRRLALGEETCRNSYCTHSILDHDYLRGGCQHENEHGMSDCRCHEFYKPEHSTEERYTILVVSGRHSSCGDETVRWFDQHRIPFHHIFMRHSFDNRKDTIVKQEILDSILKLVPKEQIAFVIDDRPAVCAMWKQNGLTVYPVRGTTDHTSNCPNIGAKFKGNCEHCGALADF